mgnify:CR=1 FL=1
MGHHQQCAAVELGLLDQHVDHVLLVLLVEVAGRLIRKQKTGFVCECPCDGHALTFATGELVRPVLDAVSEADLLEQREGSSVSLSAADGGRRVIIVDSVDEMNTNAANALLKVLEEPPARCTLLLVAHQPARLLGQVAHDLRQLELLEGADLVGDQAKGPGGRPLLLVEVGAEAGQALHAE